jgi:hypothetical protein
MTCECDAVVVAGGWANRDASVFTLTTVDQYFPALNQWRTLPNMTVPRQSAAAVRYVS